MSTAAVSSSSLYQQLQQFFHTRLSDVQQLGQALKSGDLAGAQKAYHEIAQLGQNGPFPNSVPFRSSQREQDFAAIGQALQSGDLAGAQQAFAALQATGHVHATTAPPASPAPESPVVIVNLGSSSSSDGNSPAAGNSSTGPEIVINLPNNNSSSPEQVTLNLSNQANGTEQLTVSVANQAGSNPEQITLNLAQGTNEQIILNLFNATASPSPQNGVSVVA